jgi:hypothetical protein
MRIELFTRDMHFVALVEIAPVVTPPDVVVWGTRTFTLCDSETLAYREAFAVWSLTPSPGLPREKVGT